MPPHPLFFCAAACVHSLLGLLLQTVFNNLTVFTKLPIKPDFLYNMNSAKGFQVKERIVVLNMFSLLRMLFWVWKP